MRQFICDEVKAARRDPTKTGDIRRSFYADLQRRAADLKRDVKTALTALDKNQPLDARMAAFEASVVASIDRTLYQSGGVWAGKYVLASYQRANNQASKAIGQAVAPKPTAHSVQVQLLRKDLETFSVSIEQLSARIASMGLARNANLFNIAREVGNAIDTFVKKRGTLIVAHHVIASHSEASLDAAEALGIEYVRRIPEWKSGPSKEEKAKPVDGRMSFTDSRARYVRWRTAGDDDVCPVCAQMEGEILKISAARRMIPVHPNCRCSWELLTRSRIRAEFGNLSGEALLGLGLAASYVLGITQ